MILLGLEASWKKALRIAQSEDGVLESQDEPGVFVVASETADYRVVDHFTFSCNCPRPGLCSHIMAVNISKNAAFFPAIIATEVAEKAASSQPTNFDDPTFEEFLTRMYKRISDHYAEDLPHEKGEQNEDFVKDSDFAQACMRVLFGYVMRTNYTAYVQAITEDVLQSTAAFRKRLAGTQTAIEIQSDDEDHHGSVESAPEDEIPCKKVSTDEEITKGQREKGDWERAARFFSDPLWTSDDALRSLKLSDVVDFLHLRRRDFQQAFQGKETAAETAEVSQDLISYIENSSACYSAVEDVSRGLITSLPNLGGARVRETVPLLPPIGDMIDSGVVNRLRGECSGPRQTSLLSQRLEDMGSRQPFLTDGIYVEPCRKLANFPRVTKIAQLRSSIMGDADTFMLSMAYYAMRSRVSESELRMQLSEAIRGLAISASHMADWIATAADLGRPFVRMLIRCIDLKILAQTSPERNFFSNLRNHLATRPDLRCLLAACLSYNKLDSSLSLGQSLLPPKDSERTSTYGVADQTLAADERETDRKASIETPENVAASSVEMGDSPEKGGEFRNEVAEGQNTKLNVIDEDDARQLITTIREREFHVGRSGEEMQRARLARAVHRMAEDLYAGDAHVLLELLQNADDCAYASETRHAVILTSEEGVCMLSNETGFTEENIRALSDIAASTKKNTDAVGQFGIGFKSVFMITDTPMIFSGQAKFGFSSHDDPSTVPYVCPYWIEQQREDVLPLAIQQAISQRCLQLQDFTTLIWLPSSHNPVKSRRLKVVMNTVDMMKPEDVMFLKSLTVVSLISVTSEGHTFTSFSKTFSSVNQFESRSGVTIEENKLLLHETTIKDFHEKSSVCQSHVQKTQLEYVIYTAQMEDTEPSTVSKPLRAQVAISAQTSISTPGRVFVTLPVDASGLPFHVNGNFVVSASRESIKHLDPRNCTLRELLTDIVTTVTLRIAQAQMRAIHTAAFTSMCVERTLPDEDVDDSNRIDTQAPIDLLTVVLKFMPLAADTAEFFKPLAHAVAAELRTSLHLPCADGVARPCTHVRLMPQDMTKEGMEILSKCLEKNSPVGFLTPALDPKPMAEKLKALQVEELSSDSFVIPSVSTFSDNRAFLKALLIRSVLKLSTDDLQHLSVWVHDKEGQKQCICLRDSKQLLLLPLEKEERPLSPMLADNAILMGFDALLHRLGERAKAFAKACVRQLLVESTLPLLPLSLEMDELDLCRYLMRQLRTSTTTAGRLIEATNYVLINHMLSVVRNRDRIFWCSQSGSTLKPGTALILAPEFVCDERFVSNAYNFPEDSLRLLEAKLWCDETSVLETLTLQCFSTNEMLQLLNTVEPFVRNDEVAIVRDHVVAALPSLKLATSNGDQKLMTFYSPQYQAAPSCTLPDLLAQWFTERPHMRTVCELRQDISLEALVAQMEQCAPDEEGWAQWVEHCKMLYNHRVVIPLDDDGYACTQSGMPAVTGQTKILVTDHLYRVRRRLIGCCALALPSSLEFLRDYVLPGCMPYLENDVLRYVYRTCLRLPEEWSSSVAKEGYIQCHKAYVGMERKGHEIATEQRLTIVTSLLLLDAFCNQDEMHEILRKFPTPCLPIRLSDDKFHIEVSWLTVEEGQKQNIALCNPSLDGPAALEALSSLQPAFKITDTSLLFDSSNPYDEKLVEAWSALLRKCGLTPWQTDACFECTTLEELAGADDYTDLVRENLVDPLVAELVARQWTPTDTPVPSSSDMSARVSNLHALRVPEMRPLTCSVTRGSSSGTCVVSEPVLMVYNAKLHQCAIIFANGVSSELVCAELSRLFSLYWLSSHESSLRVAELFSASMLSGRENIGEERLDTEKTESVSLSALSERKPFVKYEAATFDFAEDEIDYK